MKAFTMMTPEEALMQSRDKWQAVLDAIAEKVKTYDGSLMSIDLGHDLPYPNEYGQQSIAARCGQFGWRVEFIDDQRDGASVVIRPIASPQPPEEKP